MRFGFYCHDFVCFKKKNLYRKLKKVDKAYKYNTIIPIFLTLVKGREVFFFVLRVRVYMCALVCARESMVSMKKGSKNERKVEVSPTHHNLTIKPRKMTSFVMF